jgi:hypothetical protein
MKKFLFTVLLIISHIASAQNGKAYMFSNFKGNGEDGLHLHDPCIIRTLDGTFRMVWIAGWTERGIGYSSSKDLINWTKQKYFMVMEKEPTARNCWAAEIAYDKQNKQFLIIWSTTIPGRFPDTEKAGDTGYNHRIYSVTTKDFVSFSETKLFYDKGFNVIDATINGKGHKWFMFVKDETRNPPQKNIRMTATKSLYGPSSDPSKPITGNYWAEGPSSTKIGDTWFVYFDKYMEKKMGAVISKDLKSWDDISDKITFPDGVRHGSVFIVNKKILQNLITNGQIR